MGEQKFFSYSSYDNNCQNFALSLLYANGADDDGLISFIKQDTEYIFKNNPYLRRFVNNITDVHGRVTILKGGKLKKKLSYLYISIYSLYIIFSFQNFSFSTVHLLDFSKLSVANNGCILVK